MFCYSYSQSLSLLSSLWTSAEELILRDYSLTRLSNLEGFLLNLLVEAVKSAAPLGSPNPRAVPPPRRIGSPWIFNNKSAFKVEDEVEVTISEIENYVESN